MIVAVQLFTAKPDAVSDHFRESPESLSRPKKVENNRRRQFAYNPSFQKNFKCFFSSSQQAHCTPVGDSSLLKPSLKGQQNRSILKPSLVPESLCGRESVSGLQSTSPEIVWGKDLPSARFKYHNKQIERIGRAGCRSGAVRQILRQEDMRTTGRTAPSNRLCALLCPILVGGLVGGLGFLVFEWSFPKTEVVQVGATLGASSSLELTLKSIGEQPEILWDQGQESSYSQDLRLDPSASDGHGKRA
ncbi:hypothetical protein PGT21_008008 [Puccinia graminis f. sp. tritici]|uniref:Uncharacterized protein n=1 Tax=Puccinia graminis f. sp. tritici TaxID=56615 RepID=A0A5B0S404_PUCGR|nr:hypothetical protein PGT21_008008 [Puccinia graminis f. sp. tritici]KAA1132896.1 hypothetical protein PGTUg99_020001 [Puccinia graminis f. sp. tritici]